MNSKNKTINYHQLIRKGIVPLLVLLPIIIELVFLNRFAVNVPYWDQWQFLIPLKAYRIGDPSWVRLIWQQDDIHRQFFPRLLALWLSTQTDWNVIAEMVVSFMLVCLILVGWSLIYHRFVDESIWWFIPVVWLVFGLGQWENILSGWQITIFMMVTAVIYTFYLLSLEHISGILFAICCGTIASYSFSNGLVVWPIGLLLLLLQNASKWKIVVWMGSSAAVFGLYFYGFTLSSTVSPLDMLWASPLSFLTYWLRNVGAPIGAYYLTISLIMGIYFLSIIVFFIFSLKHIYQETVRENNIFISLLLFSLLSSFLIILGRIGFNEPTWAVGSRYFTITTTGIISIYLYGLKQRKKGTGANRIFHSMLIVIMVGLLTTDIVGWQSGNRRYTKLLNLQSTLQNHEYQPDSALANLYVNPAIVRTQAPYLEAENLTAFKQTPDLLPLTISGEGKPFGQIVPGKPLDMMFVCPTASIRDIGIVFATYGRNNNATIRISLAVADVLYYQTEINIADMNEDNSTYYFTLPEPVLNCYGHSAQLLIESLDGQTGNAVTVWTFPAYYAGQIVGHRREKFADHVVGLLLNSCHYGFEECEIFYETR